MWLLRYFLIACYVECGLILMFFILIVIPLLLIELSTTFPFSWLRQRAHDGCDWSAEEVHSSMTLDPTSRFVGGLCLLSSCFVFFFWTFDFQYCLLSQHFMHKHTMHSEYMFHKNNWTFLEELISHFHFNKEEYSQAFNCYKTPGLFENIDAMKRRK